MNANAERQPSDLATVRHWEAVWNGTAEVHSFSPRNYYDFRLSELFCRLVKPGARVIEIGCGGSRWIKYFAETLRCETWGIDYSPQGLTLTRMENAQHSAVHLVEGDFFNLELLPLEYFDFIYSLGFIEHFVESATVTRRMAQVLRPAGMAMTLVPNFTALYGTIQKAVNPETYNKHVVMDCKMLDEVHSGAGLTPLMPADWFGSFGPGVVDYGVLQRFIIPPLKLAQHATCWALHFLRLDGESRWASPYVVGVYQKTA